MRFRVPEVPASAFDWRHKRSTVALTWLALGVIILLQAQPFTYGYRRSADEVVFLSALFEGWRGVEEFTMWIAMLQGRLGFLMAMPLNILGAYLSDDYSARLIFVLMHFGVFALFSKYFSIVSATNVTRPLVIFLIVLQPIGGFHDYMPPITYPLQNTLPFLALLAARCTIVKVQPHDRAARWLLWPARVVFLLAIMTTEYAFLLATALLATEYAFTLGRNRRHGNTAVKVLLDVFQSRAFLYDASIVVLALAAYVVFRRLHPSVYEGNVIDAGLEIGRVAETTARHVLAGTIFSRELFVVASLSREALLTAAAVGILTGACLYAVLYDVRDLTSPLVVAAGTVLAMAYVTFPVAGNARQQSWCLDGGACGWLDSRLSYLGVGVVVVCIFALVLRHVPARATLVLVAVTSGVTGMVAATTYARNLHDGLAMKANVEAWERAALLACYPHARPAADIRLLRMIDPERLVRFHPDSDKAKFWRDYMRFLREHRPCPDDTAIRQADLRRMIELAPVISMGQTIEFESKPGHLYQGDGWAQQEPWGVWSNGVRANIVFIPRFAPGTEGLQLRVVFRPYVSPSVGHQTISVAVNGQVVDTWTISREMHDKGCCERNISLGRELRPGEEVDVTFHIHNPRNLNVDREIKDGRRLGLFLHAMTLTATSDKGR